MYFILFFLTNIVSPTLLLYDNTQQTSSETTINKDPCLVQTTEHFSIKNGNFNSGKLTLQSSRLIKEIMSHLTFLMEIEKPIYYSPNQQKWVIYLSFKDTFKYTPLTVDLLWGMSACHPFLIIKKSGSVICKNNTNVRFTMAACAAMIQMLAKMPRVPPTSATLDPLLDDVIYHITEQTGGSLQ